MSSFAVLLAPSWEKKPGGNPLAPDMFDYRSSNTFNYFHELNPQRRELISTVKSLVKKGDNLEEIFGVEGEELDQVVEVNSKIMDGPLMSALDRYSPGVTYEAMDFPSLPTGAQRRLLENGVIFSGLFGVLRPDDLIPNYYLDLLSSLPKKGPLTEYWREHISPLVNRRVSDKLVWDLLPEDYHEAWTDDGSYRELVRVRFDTGTRSKKTLSEEDLAPLRGQFVNVVVREAADDVEGVEEWRLPGGYRLDEDASSFDEESRIRDLVMRKGA